MTAGEGSVAVSIVDGNSVIPAGTAVAGGKWSPTPVMLTYSAVGTPAQVSDYLDGFIRQTGADEVIVTHQAPAIEARLRSVTLLAEAMQAVPAAPGAAYRRA